jgi:hypothetical protein
VNGGVPATGVCQRPAAERLSNCRDSAEINSFYSMFSARRTRRGRHRRWRWVIGWAGLSPSVSAGPAAARASTSCIVMVAPMRSSSGAYRAIRSPACAEVPRVPRASNRRCSGPALYWLSRQRGLICAQRRPQPAVVKMLRGSGCGEGGERWPPVGTVARMRVAKPLNAERPVFLLKSLSRYRYRCR